jgi:membrane-bound lytic murein transglycosylase F
MPGCGTKTVSACRDAPHGGSDRADRARRIAATALPLILALVACSPAHDNHLKRVKAAGELVVLTHVSPSTYYETPEGSAGFEYDLARAFADSLGVGLRVMAVGRSADVLPQLLSGQADLAAAGLAATPERADQFRFTPPYQEVRQQVIYRLGTTRPTGVEELIGRHIEVPKSSVYTEHLRELQQEYPDLRWTETEDKEVEDLLQMVWEGLLELTIADSHVMALTRQYFPELMVAFTTQKPVRLAWAFPPGEDDSLYQAAVKFLENARASGKLARLTDRYYGPASRSHFINLSVYHLRIQNRLPLYQSLFEEAAKKYNHDWRLLAAVGYQESYWDPDAVSPTGVRGLMMLTQTTAEYMGVADRLDPRQSIDGGARYLRYLLERLPLEITEPDRLWLALAAYNIGIHRLEDARAITRKQDGDPNKWLDVKERLPLLEQEKWYRQTRYGYARGMEAVRFVNRVRTYYDVLAKVDEEQRTRATHEAIKMKAPAI